MTTQIDLSIIIVNWNTRELLRGCIQSIFETVPPLTFEVIVVDNGSSDGSAEMVAESFPQVSLILCPENPGFAAANNRAIRQASGRYYMLLNPDTKLLPEAVGIMMEFADAHQDVAVVGPKLLNADGSLQMNGRRFPTVLREVLGLTRLDRCFPKAYNRMVWGREGFDQTVEVDEVMGACMLVRRSVVDEIGVMDESFFMYYEEVDWCLRMKKAGHRIYYLPDAQVVHFGGQASEQTGVHKFVMAFDSEYYFFKKHHGLLQALVLRTISWGLIAAIYLKRQLAKVLRGARHA